MTDLNLQELEQKILRRLSAVDVTSHQLNEASVTGVLEKYLDFLGLPRRPIIWAKDGKHAHKLVAQSDRSAVEDEILSKVEPVFGRGLAPPVPIDEATWTDARDAARVAGHGLQLDLVKELIRGHSVILSVPWRFYEGRFTGDRGRRTSPGGSHVWQAAADALEYGARAAADCAWARGARSGSVPLGMARLSQQKETHPSYEDIWLSFVAAFEAGLWLFWITPARVIALPRPRLQLNGDQLHKVDGPAVSWIEGEEEYFFLNGVHVPREFVETPARELDPRLLLHERNVQVRREIVRKIGIERICDALSAECLDSQGNYELLLLDLQDGRTRPFLKMKNPSIGVYHIEGVAPECRTVAEALTWRNQSDLPPSVLT